MHSANNNNLLIMEPVSSTPRLGALKFAGTKSFAKFDAQTLIKSSKDFNIGNNSRHNYSNITSNYMYFFNHPQKPFTMASMPFYRVKSQCISKQYSLKAPKQKNSSILPIVHNFKSRESTNEGINPKGHNKTLSNEIQKRYGVNNETFKNSWVEHEALNSNNYASVPYNIMNFGRNNSCTSIPQSKANAKLCHKLKSISEIYDLTRVTASKLNLDYQKVYNNTPKAFCKVKGICNTFCDCRKSYGPFYQKNV